MTTGSPTSLGIAEHKLIPPRPLPTALDRTRLLDRLDSATSRTIVITAGAGFGKSTLLSQWVDRLARPSAWLTLDAGDNDPIRLLRSIIACLCTVGPRDELTLIGRDAQAHSIDRSLARLDSCLRATTPFVCIIDDIHVVTDPAAGAVLDETLTLIPDGCRVVLAGRTEPPVRTARRALAGELETVDAAELLFTSDESQTLLDEFSDRTEPEVLGALAEQVRGWPAGVQFVALGLRSATSGLTPNEPLQASGKLLTTYFQQEFIRSLSADDLAFLMSTSVLERLSGELCDYVLDDVDSAEHLDELVRSGNVFVVPIGTSGVFEYHPLFRELLLRELRRRTPDLEAPLRRRGIEWHEMHHEWNAAVDQALASRGLIDAPAVIFKHVRATVSTAQVASVGRWLAAFEPSEVRSNALLALSASWHALFTDSYGEIDRWLETAAACDHQGPLPDGTVDVPTAIAAVQMFAATGGVQMTAAAARTVIDAGAGGGPWRSVALLLEAVALQLSGTVDDVRSLLEVAEFETRGFPAGHAVVLAHLGIDALYQHDATRGNQLVRAALDEVESAGIRELGHISMVFVGKALADARAGAFEASRQASDHVEHLASTLRTVHARGWIHQHLILADAAIFRGDWFVASRLHREAHGRLHLQPDAVVLHEWAARIERRCAAHQGLGHRVELTPAEQRVLGQLATHRTLAEIGEHLYVSRNTVKTHAVSIYRKLQVSGRGEAVTRAIEWSLLAGTVEDRQRTAVTTR